MRKSGLRNTDFVQDTRSPLLLFRRSCVIDVIELLANSLERRTNAGPNQQYPWHAHLHNLIAISIIYYICFSPLCLTVVSLCWHGASNICTPALALRDFLQCLFDLRFVFRLCLSLVEFILQMRLQSRHVLHGHAAMKTFQIMLQKYIVLLSIQLRHLQQTMSQNWVQL